jgi:dTDP-4-amino-4,6-dideoxygalactose transaminase
MESLGFNYRLSDIHAVLGLTQLGKLERFVADRRRIAARYDRAFDGNPYFEIPSTVADTGSSYHLYPIFLKEGLVAHKPLIFRFLRERGLGVQVHYMPVAQHPYYRRLGFVNTHTPHATAHYLRELSIPLHPAMTDADVENSVAILLDVFHGESGGRGVQ